jgi:hypothetical protein
MAKECSGWVGDLDRVTPSVVLSFKTADGVDIIGARVTIDDKPTPLDGRPIPLDPGPHKVRADADGFTPFVEDVLLEEGQQGRRISATLHSLEHLIGPVKRPSPSPIPSIVVGGVAVVALGLGIGFGSSALILDRELTKSCAPGCAPSKVTPDRVRAAVADTSFAVSAVATAIAIGIAFRPGPASGVALVPIDGGGTLRFEAAF